MGAEHGETLAIGYARQRIGHRILHTGQFVLGEFCQVAEQGQVVVAESARNAIEDAQGAELVSVRQRQGASGVEPNLRFADDQRIVAEPLVEERVGNDEDLVVEDRVCAERHIATGLGRVESAVRLALFVVWSDQADEHCRCIEQAPGDSDQPIEALFERGVELSRVAQ